MRIQAMRRTDRGIALLIVLWVIAILMVSVLSFSLLTRAESYGTLSFQETTEKQLFAEAGIARGVAEIIYRTVNSAQTVTLEGKELWKTDGTPYSDQIGNGSYRVSITDESGKISLNGLSDSSAIILKNLLVKLGVSPEEADTIGDSVLDWKDTDDLHRLSGAEDDYYQSLPHPYKARNADFQSLEELLLVKGVTPDILYGTDRRKGLIHFLTLYNPANSINLNAAPREILESLPGTDAAMVDLLIQFRDETPIKSAGDVAGILGGATALLSPYVSVQPGATLTCTIEASGFKGTEKGGFPIRATVAMEGPDRYRYLYYRSPAEAWH